METPRKKFYRDVRNFRKFKHSRVSELEVEDELITFKYTPEPPVGSPPKEPINVMLLLQDSPETTRVLMGSMPEVTYHKKTLADIMNTVLKTLASTDMTTAKSPRTPPAPQPVVPDPAARPYDPLYDAPDSSLAGRSLGSSGLRSSSVLADSGELVFQDMMPVTQGAQVRDSRGAVVNVSEDLKNDIEAFWSTYGKDSLEVTTFEEEVILLLDLGVSKVIGRDTMMAWNFDTTKKVFARLKTSVYYRDGGAQKLTVQQGYNISEKFAPQFQLEHILNTFVSATWAKGSPPFKSPLDGTYYGDGSSAPAAAAAAAAAPGSKIEGTRSRLRSLFSRNQSQTSAAAAPAAAAAAAATTTTRRRKVHVDKNLREMVNMGFDIAKAKKALMLSENDLQTAVSLCCDCADSLDTSDMMTPELDDQLAAIMSGDADEEGDGAQGGAATTETAATANGGATNIKQKSYLVEIVRYMQSRIPTLNQRCIICDQEHLLGQMLKPTVCTRELCCWAFQELGVAAGATDFVATTHEVVDMLLLFAKEAAQSHRRNQILDPYPLVFDPANRNRKVFDPDHKDYEEVNKLISRIPTMESIVKSNAGSVADALNAVSPYAYPLLTWIMASNRSFIVKLPETLAISQLGGEQFLMLSSPPDKEKVFRSLRKQYGSVFTFHGSPSENWHSIVRNGLRNASGTALQLHGTAYGKGIYMSPSLGTAGGYTAGGKFTVVAVCEVINHDIKKATADIWTVANESYVTTRMLLLYRGRSTAYVSGDAVASKIRDVMRYYGVDPY